MFSRCLVLAAAFSVIGSTAAAQDGSEVLNERTPAGANAFLDEFLRDSGARVSLSTFFPNRYSRSDRARFQNWRLRQNGEREFSSNWEQSNASFVSATQTAPCRTRFTLTDFRYRGAVANEPNPNGSSIATPGQTVSIEVDWSKVTAIVIPSLKLNASQGFVIPFWMEDNLNPAFELSTVEAANRVGFAINYLRSACAPRPTSGF